MSDNVLQEYLIKLGYQVDALGFRRFDRDLGATSQRILSVGKGVAGIAVATAVATAAFAYDMRKMFFASELANTSVKNLKNMEYAAKQVGISEDSMGSAILSVGRALRGADPAMEAFIKGLGITTEGREANDVLFDLLTKLKQFPEFVGAQHAANFLGMSVDDFHLAITNLDKLRAKELEHDKMLKDMHVDFEKSRQAVFEYAETIDDLGARFTILGQATMVKFLPAMRDTSLVLKDTISWWTDWANGINSVDAALSDLTLNSAWGFLKDVFGLEDISAKTVTGGAHKVANYLSGGLLGKAQGFVSSTFNSLDDPEAAPAQKAQAGPTAVPSATPGTLGGKGTKSQDYLNNLDKKFGLPEGLLYKVFGMESTFGKNVDSPAGAQGPMQLMPATSKSMGVKNPYDFKESTEAAGTMFQRLSKKYGQDIEKAAGAYNWGEGNIDAWLKTGKGTRGQAMPEETKGYMKQIRDMYAGKGPDDHLASYDKQKLGAESAATQNLNITNQNTFHITGSDSAKIAETVVKKQDRVNADTARQMKVSYR